MRQSQTVATLRNPTQQHTNASLKQNKTKDAISNRNTTTNDEETYKEYKVTTTCCMLSVRMILASLEFLTL